MSVKQVFDHSLRAHGKRFLNSLKASNGCSEDYLASLETAVAMAAQYAEEQGWPDVQEITTEHIEDYLAYLQDRTRWFGERTVRRTPEAVQRLHQRPVPPIEPVLQLAGGARAHPTKIPCPPSARPSWRRRRFPQSLKTRCGTCSPSLTLPLPEHPPTASGWFATGRYCTPFGTRRADSSEIAKLQLNDVDLANGTLLVMGKGRKERKMPIGDTARSAIVGLPAGKRRPSCPAPKLLWVSEQGEALLPNGICQLLKRLAKSSQY